MHITCVIIALVALIALAAWYEGGVIPLKDKVMSKLYWEEKDSSAEDLRTIREYGITKYVDDGKIVDANRSRLYQ